MISLEYFEYLFGTEYVFGMSIFQNFDVFGFFGISISLDLVQIKSITEIP